MDTEKENKPLSGKKIVITRPPDQADEFTDYLIKLGAEVIKFPVIDIAPPDNWNALDLAIDKLDDYGWVIFTSVNGVKSFIGRLIERGKDIKGAMFGVRICSVGLKTADAVEQYGLRVDFVPEEFRAEAIAEGFETMGALNEKVLIPRAQAGREVLPEELSKMGYRVDVVPVYKVVRPDIDVSWLKKMLSSRKIDMITFTSGSCVRNFIEFLGMEEYKLLLTGVKIACISPVTAESMRKYGIETDVIPERYTIEDLTDAIARYYM